MGVVQTVFVVDDNPEMRKSLSDFLQAAGQEVRSFDSGKAFLSFYKPEMPGCLILDIQMPEMTGIELQEILCSQGFALPIIVVSGGAAVMDAVKTMKLGTFDFIEKPFDPHVLLARVQEALNHDRKNRADDVERRQIRERYAKLTAREREVLDAVVAGLPSKEIADKMGLTISTVDNHRANIMKKMGATTSADLTRIVLSLN
jgi:FixJ family two-component response regulator